MSVRLDFTSMFLAGGNDRPLEAEKENCIDNLETKVQFDNLSKDEESWQRERSHWQEQTSEIALECDKLRCQAMQFEKEKEKDDLLIRSLKQEVHGLTNKMGAMLTEHREVRNHWLAEKAELEAKNFHLQAVVTQCQGTLRKKEKDFEKLQNHLQKQVKDSQRGSKSSISLSKPVQKNSSQVSKAPTLRDAELMAHSQKIHSLEVENEQLRMTLEVLSLKINEFKQQCESRIALADARTHHERLELEQQLEQSRQLVESLQHQNGPQEVKSPPTTEMHVAPVTPCVRHQPAAILAEKITTDIKRLGVRCLEAATPFKGPLRELEADDRQSMLEELESLRKLVREQDALIHQALLGQLPGLVENANAWDDFEPKTNYKVKTTQSSSLIDELDLPRAGNFFDDLEWEDKQFLPPASPATRSLLQQCGISPLVQNVASKSTSKL